MLNETEPAMSFEEAAEFIRNFPRPSRRQRRDFSRLSQPISDYLRADKQRLKDDKGRRFRPETWLWSDCSAA
jgi:hypothetical protein